MAMIEGQERQVAMSPLVVLLTMLVLTTFPETEAFSASKYSPSAATVKRSHRPAWVLAAADVDQNESHLTSAANGTTMDNSSIHLMTPPQPLVIGEEQPLILVEEEDLVKLKLSTGTSTDDDEQRMMIHDMSRQRDDFWKEDTLFQTEGSDVQNTKNSIKNGSNDIDEKSEDALQQLEESLLATIEMLEDTLQETQIVNELEIREWKEKQRALEEELKEQMQWTQQAMAQVQLERFVAERMLHKKSSLDVNNKNDKEVKAPKDLLDEAGEIQNATETQNITALAEKNETEATELAPKPEQDETFQKQEAVVEGKQLEPEEDITKSQKEEEEAGAQQLEENEKLQRQLQLALDERVKAQETVASIQQEWTKTKRSLAESMAQVGRLETKLAKMVQEKEQQESKTNSSSSNNSSGGGTSDKKSSSRTTVPQLDSWELTAEGEVQGFVSNHPALPDGEPIRTSLLINPKLARTGATVKTRSGSSYKLLSEKKQETIEESSAPPPVVQKKEEPKPAAAKKSLFGGPPVAQKEKEEPKPAETATTASKKKSLFGGIGGMPSFPSPASKPEVKKKDETTSTTTKEAAPRSLNLFANRNNLREEKSSTVEKEAKKEEINESKQERQSMPSINLFGSNKKSTPVAGTAPEQKEKEAPSESAAAAPRISSPSLPQINIFGNNNNKAEVKDEPEESPRETAAKKQPSYKGLNLFGNQEKNNVNKKSTEPSSSDTETKEKDSRVNAKSSPSYGAKTKTKGLQAKDGTSSKLELTGKSFCDGKYLLAGKAKKSVTGRCLILGAYHSDGNSNPSGQALAIKLSENHKAMKKEHSIYKKVSSGVNRGVIVKCHGFLPDVQERPGKAALILERGVRDLKEHRRWHGLNGEALKEALYSINQCMESFHSARMVWTDMKTENFVIVEDESSGEHSVKAIDLESAMNVRENPIDYTPEATPPEFAKAFVSGDPHSFVLDYSFDVWSFGMLSYELATGVGYFDGNSPDAIMRKLSQNNVPNASIGIDDDDLIDLISQCLSLDPKQRPSAQKISRHPYFSSVSKPSGALFQLW
eukprot:scaffold1640_cov101-Cylindrotheca_fusiformis.AAC.1